MPIERDPADLVQDGLDLLAEPLGAFVDSTMRSTSAHVIARGKYWVDAHGTADSTPVSSLWIDWTTSGEVPLGQWREPRPDQWRDWGAGDIQITARLIDSWWRIVFKRCEPFASRMGAGGQTMFKELLEYRNHKYHDHTIDEFQAARGLETISRILHAIGEDSASRRVHELRQPLLERQARGGTPLDRGRHLTDKPPPKDWWCIGAHWMEPAPDLPEAWWIVALRGGSVELLRRDLTTDEVTEYLVDKAQSPSPALIGLAYCFSTPTWFVESLDPPHPSSFWRRCEVLQRLDSVTPTTVAAALGPPFRESGKDPEEPLRAGQSELRLTEQRLGSSPATSPSSVFRIGGTGSVGGLAVLGAPVLHRIREAGVHIWPIDNAGMHTAVEIFPRGLWGGIDPLADPISSQEARAQFLADPRIRQLQGLGGGDREVLQRERRAFDAFLTAWALSQYGGSIAARTLDATDRIEGQIWIPE